MLELIYGGALLLILGLSWMQLIGCWTGLILSTLTVVLVGLCAIRSDQQRKYRAWKEAQSLPLSSPTLPTEPEPKL